MKLFFEFIICCVAVYFTSILFRVPQKARLFCALLGGSGYTVMKVMQLTYNNPMIIYFIATLYITVISEVLARLLKMPATVFTVPSIIALVPGLKLYESMTFLTENNSEAVKIGTEALQSVLGMAMAMVLTSSLTRSINRTLTAILNKIRPNKL